MPPAGQSYFEQAKARKAELLKRARAIAGHLGDGWRAEDENDCDYCVLQNGKAALRLNGGNYRHPGRFVLSAMPYHDNHGQAQHLGQFPKKITVTQKKSDKQIAQDIARRILPGAIEFYANSRERLESERDRERRLLEARRLMAEALDDPCDPATYQRNNTFGSYSGLRCQVVHADSFELTIESRCLDDTLRYIQLLRKAGVPVKR